MAHLTIPIRGMHCASCALVIEKELAKKKGVTKANVNYALERASVAFDETLTGRAELEQTIRDTGYEPAIEETKRTAVPETHDHAAHANRTSTRELIASFILLIPLLLGMFWMPEIGTLFGRPAFSVLSFVCAAILVLWIGRHFHHGAWNELKHRRANMDTLVTIGTFAALAWSAYALVRGEGELYVEVAGFIIVFLSLGKFLEERQRMKAGEAISSLLNLHPKLAHQLHADGTMEDVDPSQLRPGDLCVVKPGERIPIDGIITQGRSTIDESMLTGEPIPAERQKGDMIYAATINGTGSFTMSVTTEPGKTMLDAIVATVEHALTAKSPVERLVDKISSVFVPVVIVTSILSLFAWLILTGNPGEAIRIAVAVLIVACPCAMGLATPAAIMVGTGAGAARGILIKDGSALEAARRIDVVVFDKTGTLTEGKPVITDLLEGKDESIKPYDLLEIAGSLESRSEHPLASAILKYIEEKHAKEIDISHIEHSEAVIGKGLKGILKGSHVSLGTEAFMQEQGIGIPEDLQEKLEKLRRAAKTIVFVSRESMLIGAIAIQDKIKPEAKQAIDELRKLNISAGLITGDHLATANAVAQELGITSHVYAGVSPTKKAEIIRTLQEEGKRVAFVGDGINDAPALATAMLGIAIGTGTDIAIATGQIVIMKGSPLKATEAIILARATFRAIKQNLFWAFIYNTVGIPLAAAGLLNPMLAGAAMAMSSVSVLGNSLRVKRTLK